MFGLSLVDFQLRKLGAKNVEAGVGCGVGFGHGFGVGMSLFVILQEKFTSMHSTDTSVDMLSTNTSVEI